MKLITYNNETHTLKEWIEILKLSDEVHRDFVNDDLIEFAKELRFVGRITNANLYKAYTLWCDGNPMPPTIFQKRIVKSFKLCRKDLQSFRTSKVRGWENVTCK